MNSRMLLANGEEYELKTDAEFVQFVKAHSLRLDLEGMPVVGAEVQDLSGNINRVLRVRLKFAGGSSKSFVVKHVPAEGRLERYPAIVFPENRLQFEVQWFELAERLRSDSGVRTPHVLYLDEEMRLIIMEDLEPLCSLGEFLRQRGNERRGLLIALGQFLGRVHKGSLAAIELANPGAALNRPFVFTMPLVEPDKMCTIWEETEKSETADDAHLLQITLAERIKLQQRYLNESAGLVLTVVTDLEQQFKQGHQNVFTHGDLHAESVLVLADGKLGVVDAELCDYGAPGFDLGMLCGHLWASRLVAGAEENEIARELGLFLGAYVNEFFGHGATLTEEIEALYESSVRHCGAEILRRLLGAAGFGFQLSVCQFEELLADATRFLLAPKDCLNGLKDQGLM